MKKLLILLFSLIFLSSTSVFAEEDLSKVNINNLKRLSSNEIIDAFSNTRSVGYYSGDIYGIDFEFEEFNYSNGDFNHLNIFFSASGKWKAYDNKMCFKATQHSLTAPEKMFTCVVIYTGFKEMEYYFYMPGQGIYAKTTIVIPLID